MARLEDLEKKLYGAGDKEIEKRMRWRVFFPGMSHKPPSSWIDRMRPVKTGEPKRPSNTWYRLFFMVIIALFVIGGGLFAWFYVGTRGQEVRITIQGREEVESGEIITIPVVFRNITSVTLKDVELVVLLPEGSMARGGSADIFTVPRVMEKIDDVGAGEERIFEIPVRMFGYEGEEKTVEATLRYRPENLRAEFLARETKTFKVARVPLNLTWEIPANLSRGQTFEIKVRYVSDAAASYEQMTFRVQYPPGFSFISADPKPDGENALWNVGTIERGKENIITIRGTISGEEGEVKTFVGGLGVYDFKTKAWKAWREVAVETHIAVTPLAVQGFLGGVRERTVNPGEQLNVSVQYRNNTPYTIRNVSVRAFLEAESLVRPNLASGLLAGDPKAAQDVLDFGSFLIRGGGVFDALTRSVVWGPAASEGLREVSPGQNGTFELSVRVREQSVIRSEKDKNIGIRLRTHIDAAGSPDELRGTDLSSQDSLVFKLRTKTAGAARSVYHVSPIPNSGPLPPRVGKKTSYAIMFELQNFTNDLENFEIRAFLPPNVVWENVMYPKDMRITHDASSGQIRWTIGTLRAGIGVLGPSLTGAFQVSVTPSEADVGRPLLLMQEARASAFDVFVKEDHREEFEAVSTELRSDSGSNGNEWNVVR